jgi:hypothetical protein
MCAYIKILNAVTASFMQGVIFCTGRQHFEVSNILTLCLSGTSCSKADINLEIFLRKSCLDR